MRAIRLEDGKPAGTYLVSLDPNTRQATLREEVGQDIPNLLMQDVSVEMLDDSDEIRLHGYLVVEDRPEWAPPPAEGRPTIEVDLILLPTGKIIQ